MRVFRRLYACSGHGFALGRVLRESARGLVSAALMASTAQAVGSQMFATVPASTGEKPQSKIWYHDGSYWAILQGPSGVAFYEKVSSTWQLKTFTNAILTTSGNADVKWNGTDLFVLNYAPTTRLFKYSYAAATRAWVLAAGFPVLLPNPAGSETMVLEQDSTGRLWTTAEGGGNINVYYSTSADHRTWITSPVVLRTGVLDDDISSVVAFGGNKIGVFWSDQVRWEFGFRVHNDADPPATWGATEVVVSGTGVSDDHLNLAFDSSGRVYAITKDASDLMRVHRRATNGTWTTKTNVFGNVGTRGILMVSESDAKVYILCTRWDVTPYRIAYRVADIGTLTFGSSVDFISTSTDLNNVTGMKQLLPAGSLVAIAESGTHCWYNSFGAPPGNGPGAPQNLTASLQYAPERVDLTWSQPAGGAPDGYNVYRQADGGPWSKLNAALLTVSTFTDGPPPRSPLCYMVRAVAAGVEGSMSDAACVDNSPLPAPGPPQSLTVTLTDLPATTAAVELGFDEGNGQSAQDASGNANHARLGSSTGADGSDPAWTTGVSGSALRFDGSNDYIEIADAPVLDLAGSFTVEAWTQFDLGAATGTLANKGDSGERNMRIRFTSGRDVEFRWDATSGSTREVIATGALPDAAWHHVACVYDQAAAENRIYVDGVLRAAAAAAGVPMVNAKPLHVGARFTTSFQNYFDGAIDVFRITPLAVYSGSFVPSLLASATLPGVASQRAALAWLAPASGAAAVSYDVYRSTGGGFTRLNTAPVTVLSFQDGPLDPGTYCYYVTAANVQDLDGAPSATVCAAVLPPVPAAPAGLTAELVLLPGAPVPGSAAYPFDEGQGQSFASVLAASHPGLRGASPGEDDRDPLWNGGLFGGCLRFDGVDDRAQTGDAPDLGFVSSFTVEAWMMSHASGATQTILAKGRDEESNYRLALDADAHPRLHWRDLQGAEYSVTGTTSIARDSWHHVAGVFDSAAAECRVYVDGVLAGATPAAGVPRRNSSPLVFGAAPAGNGHTQYFSGNLDLIRVSPGALYAGPFTPPQSFTAPPGRRVEIAWQPSSGNLVAGYNLYRQVASLAPERLNATLLTGVVFTDLAPVPGPVCYRVAVVDTLGRESAPSSPGCVQFLTTDTAHAPAASNLYLRAVPNPFNPVTRLSFQLDQTSSVDLVIYDARGRIVTTLLSGALPAGRHTTTWTAAEPGLAVPSGLYFAVLHAGARTARTRIVLLK